MDFARIMQTFDGHNVSFVSVTQAFNTTHSMGRLTLNILLSFAQFEREIISERTRDKIAAARRKGKWMGGHPLLGYDVENHPGGSRLVVNDDEARRVRQIFELYLEEQSLIRTVAELNARGWTTSNGHERGGQPFDKASLRRLLSNVVYLGKVRYKDEVHTGEHEAIVDEGIWQRVQQMLRSNGLSGGMHVRNARGALLKGLLHCKPCKRAMMHTYTSKGNRRYRYYVCYTAQKQGWQACPSKSVPAEQIERFVVEQIRAIGFDATVMSLTLEQARAHEQELIDALENDVRVVDREVRQLELEIKRTARDAATNGHAVDRLADLQHRLRPAEQKRIELRGQITEAQRRIVSKAEVDSALDAFMPLWDALRPREQARALQLLIRRVDYDGANGKIVATFCANGIRTLGQKGWVAFLEEESCPAA
jgi:site-specific DNA recombinase